MEILNKQRPVFVTILCGFYFVYWAINIVRLIAQLLISIGSQFPAFSEIANQVDLIFLGAQVNINWVTWFIAAGLIAGIVGYWFMQRWAVIVYAASSVALFIVTLPLIAGAPTKILYIGLILATLAAIFSINIAMIVIGVIYFKRMK